jgi:hypothetical protein
LSQNKAGFVPKNRPFGQFFGRESPSLSLNKAAFLATLARQRMIVAFSESGGWF